MSLINEALKKAQKMRQTPDAAEPAKPGDAATPPTSVPKRNDPMPAGRVMILAFSAIGALILAAVVVVMVLLPDDEQPTVSVQPVARTINPSDSAPTIQAAPEPAATLAIDRVAPSIVTAEPLPVEPPAPVAAETAAPAETESTAAVAATSAPTSTPIANPQVYEFLDTLRIMGVRVSATDPKVLMNERLFRLNEIVHRGLGLRITGISSDTLTFTDETGFVYTKTF